MARSEIEDGMDERPGRRSMRKMSNVNNVNLEIRDWRTGV